MTTKTPKTPLDHALAYAARGWSVLPGMPGAKTPAVSSTRLATKDPDQIKRWWGVNPHYNVIVKCAESGLLVVDVDVKHARHTDWERANMHLLQGARVHKTGSGGRHYLFRLPQGVATRSSIVDGPDIRGGQHCHYIVAPPSMNSEAGDYAVVSDVEPPDPPEELLKIVRVQERAPDEIPSAPAGSTLVEKLWGAAGLPTGDVRLDPKTGVTVTNVECPMGHTHSVPKGKRGRGWDPHDSSAALLSVGAQGAFRCHHETHGRLDTAWVVDWIIRTYPEAADKVLREAGLRVELGPVAPKAHADEVAQTLAGWMRLVWSGEPGLYVARVTTGVGKTECYIRQAVEEGVPLNVFLPNHALAEEVVARFQRGGIEARHPRGILAFGDVCQHIDRVRRLQMLGVPARQSLCLHCEHRQDYLGTGEPCEAGAMVGDKHRIQVLMHAQLPKLLQEAEGTTLVIDEMPPMTEEHTLDGLALREARAHLEILPPGEDRKVVQRVLDCLEAALSQPPGTELSLRDVLLDGAAAGFARDVDNGAGAGQLAFGAERGVEREIIRLMQIDPSPGADTRASLGALARSRPKAFGAVADAWTTAQAAVLLARTPDAKTIVVGDGSISVTVRAAWVGEAVGAVRRGCRVVLLSATLPPREDLETILGAPITYTSAEAADAPTVRRVYVKSLNATRKALRDGSGVNVEALRAALVEAWRAFPEGSLKERTLIVTHKIVAEALRSTLSREGLVLPECWRTPWRAGAITLDVEHYGAVLGKDGYKEHDAVILLGAPVVNLDAAKMQARALGVATERHLNSLTQGELCQAAGRLRSCRTCQNQTVIYIGHVQPDPAFAPQWVGYLPVKVAAQRVALWRRFRAGRGRSPSGARAPRWGTDRPARSCLRSLHVPCQCRTLPLRRQRSEVFFTLIPRGRQPVERGMGRGSPERVRRGILPHRGILPQ